ncbi:MAG: prolipoprotein diacylglyceryl transferase [Lachnospiraceae bacterium]|nr:prolipoprotein diacylglyceryl transferase [Lachnospiraceae bacterium]
MTPDIRFPHLGIEITSLGKGITIGGFTIAFYGMIIAFGMVMGYLMTAFQAKRTGQEPDLYLDLALWDIVFAVIGARIYYVIFSWDYYKDNLLQIFNTRGGGLAIYGGVIAGVITTIIFGKIRKQNFFQLLDTACVGLITGQIIGRWGNFCNREAFGGYTDSLLAMQLKESDVAPANLTHTVLKHIVEIDGVRYIQVHPTFLYESLWNVGVLIILLLFTKHRRYNGQIFLIYLLGYGLGRVWIEGLRTDQLIFFGTGVAVSQVLSGVLVVISAGILICQYCRGRRSKQL